MASVTEMSGIKSRGLDVEEAYTSPQTPFAGSLCPVSSTSSDKRSERSRRSSNDSNADSSDGFINDHLRAGSPYLCAIPGDTYDIQPKHPLFQRLIINNNTSTVTKVVEILHQFDIHGCKIDFCTRRSCVDPEPEPILTLLILVRRNDVSVYNEKWVNAARNIWQYLHQEGLGDLAVEIADPQVFESIKYFPVRQTDAIAPVWKEVCGTIINRLSHNLKEWLTLACFRVGRSADANENPPTIVLTVSKTSTRDWQPVRDGIVEILNRRNLDSVGVLIIKDKLLFVTGPRPSFPYNTLTGEASVGQSLAPCNWSGGSGTFGGWVEVQDKNSGIWYPFGITFFHCVLPDGLDVLDKDIATMVHPQDNKDTSRTLRIESPSSNDITTELTNLEDQISQFYKNEKFNRIEKTIGKGHWVEPTEKRNYNVSKKAADQQKAQRAQLQTFMQDKKGYLGYVWAGSGYQDKNMVRNEGNLPVDLDWALIRVESDRLGGNKITTFGPRYVFPWLDGISFTAYKPNPSLDSGRLYKVGRTSGYTEGEYGGLEVARIATKSVNGEETLQPTWEHYVLLRADYAFAANGDSGSLVFNDNMEVVGLFFGKNERQDLYYFTHVDVLFEDIKRSTGASAVRIMQ